MSIDREATKASSDKVLIRVVTTRIVMEPRVDVDGVEDFYVIRSDTVDEREWIENRKGRWNG